MRIKKQKVYFESKIMSDIKTSIHNTFILYTIFFLSKYGLHSSGSDDSQRWQFPGKLCNIAGHNIYSRSCSKSSVTRLCLVGRSTPVVWRFQQRYTYVKK